MSPSKIDAIIDDLLARWHDYRSGYALSKGHASSSASCQAESDWSAYDRDNGVTDQAMERDIMRAVDRAIERIPNTPHPWHTMICFEARNLWCEVAVWTSARLPNPKTPEFEVIRLEARAKLMVQLQREGCLG